MTALGRRCTQPLAGAAERRLRRPATAAGSGRRPSGSRELGDGVHGEEVAGGVHGEEVVAWCALRGRGGGGRQQLWQGPHGGGFRPAAAGKGHEEDGVRRPRVLGRRKKRQEGDKGGKRKRERKIKRNGKRGGERK